MTQKWRFLPRITWAEFEIVGIVCQFVEIVDSPVIIF